MEHVTVPWFLLLSIYRIEVAINGNLPIDSNSKLGYRETIVKFTDSRLTSDLSFSIFFSTLLFLYGRLLFNYVGHANVKAYENRVCRRLEANGLFLSKIEAKNRLASRRIVHECDAGRSTTVFYMRAGHVTPPMEKRTTAHAPVNVYTCTVDPPPWTIQHVLWLSSRRTDHFRSSKVSDSLTTPVRLSTDFQSQNDCNLEEIKNRSDCGLEFWSLNTNKKRQTIELAAFARQCGFALRGGSN